MHHFFFFGHLQGRSDIQLMYVIFTLFGVVGTVATSFLPESYKEEFPECVEDIERRPRYPYFSWRVWNYKKVQDGEEEGGGGGGVNDMPMK